MIFLLSFTCNYVVSVLRGFHFLFVLGIGCVFFLWHPATLPYNYFVSLLNKYTSFIINSRSTGYTENHKSTI